MDRSNSVVPAAPPDIRTLQSCEAPPGSFRSCLTSGYPLTGFRMEKRVDDGWGHRTQRGVQSSTAAPQGPGSASPAFPRLGAPPAPPTAPGRREVLLRPPAHVGAHPVLGAQLPAPGVQPD